MTYQAPAGGFRTFLILWVSQSVSLFGTAMTFFAVNIWLVQDLYPLPEQQPQLAWALAAVGLGFGIPSMLFMPIAGSLVDRWDRKRIMFLTDIGSGLLVAALAWLVAEGMLTLPLLLGLIVPAALLATLHMSAFDTAYASLVNDSQLPRANGMMQTMHALSQLLSPGLAAIMISLPAMARQGLMPDFLSGWLGALRSGAPLAMTLDAVTFWAAAAALLFLSIPSPPKREGEKRGSIWADVRFGARFIWARPPLLSLLFTFAVANFTLQMGVFMPLIVKYQLSADWSVRGFTLETAMAALNTAFAVGGVAGGVLISTWGGLKKHRALGVLVPLVIEGFLLVICGLTGNFWLAVVLIAMMSMGGPIGNSHSQAIWQTQVPREMQGRVFAIRRVLALSAGPLGQVAAGFMAGIMAPGVALALFAGLMGLHTLAHVLFNRPLLHVDEKEYLDRIAAQRAAAS